MLMRSSAPSATVVADNDLRLEMELQQVSYAELMHRDVSQLLPKKPTHARSVPVKDEGKKETSESDAGRESANRDPCLQPAGL